jgi:hypothetical protein
MHGRTTIKKSYAHSLWWNSLCWRFLLPFLLVMLSIGQKVTYTTDCSPPKATHSTESCLSSDSVLTQWKLKFWELVFRAYCTWNEFAEAVVFEQELQNTVLCLIHLLQLKREVGHHAVWHASAHFSLLSNLVIPENLGVKFMPSEPNHKPQVLFS